VYDHQNSLQQSLYLDCQYRYIDYTEWMAVMDVDEFLEPVNDSSLLPLLNKYETRMTSGLR
jgi:hypothetical protein